MRVTNGKTGQVLYDDGTASTDSGAVDLGKANFSLTATVEHDPHQSCHITGPHMLAECAIWCI